MSEDFQDQVDGSIEDLGLLTPEESADLVGVSPSAIAKARRAGKLHGYTLPSGIMYRRDELLKRWPNMRPLKRSGPRDENLRIGDTNHGSKEEVPK